MPAESTLRITSVTIEPVDEGVFEARVSITLGHSIAVHGLKLLGGGRQWAVAMPSRKRHDGTHHDVAHPLNAATREAIETAILRAYLGDDYEDGGGAGAPSPPRPRPPARPAAAARVFPGPPEGG